MKILKRINQIQRQYKKRQLCRFGRNVVINATSTFEGNNRLDDDVTFLNSKIGYASYVSNDSFIKNNVIGRYCCIAPRVITVTGNHPVKNFASIHPAFFSTMKQVGFAYVSEDKFDDFNYIDSGKKISVEIGNDVWIGDSVRILEGVKIGNGAVIAAGAVVTKNVPPYAIVGGIPTRIIRYRFSEQIIEKLENLEWWNKDQNWIETHAYLFEDAEKLLEMCGGEFLGR